MPCKVNPEKKEVECYIDEGNKVVVEKVFERGEDICYQIETVELEGDSINSREYLKCVPNFRAKRKLERFFGRRGNPENLIRDIKTILDVQFGIIPTYRCLVCGAEAIPTSGTMYYCPNCGWREKLPPHNKSVFSD